MRTDHSRPLAREPRVAILSEVPRLFLGLAELARPLKSCHPEARSWPKDLLLPVFSAQL